jgi:hypothetical protein
MITELDLKLFLNEKICEIADVLMNYYDCCHIQGTSCKAGDPNPCCNHTLYGGEKCPFGSTNKCNFTNCNCKLWLCNTAIETTDPKCIQALNILEFFAKLYDLKRAPFIGGRYKGADKP